MKHYLIFVMSLSFFALNGWANEASELIQPAGEKLRGIRYMCDKKGAMAHYETQKEAQRLRFEAENLPEEMTEHDFPDFFKKYVQPLYVEHQGKILQVSVWGPKGKIERKRRPPKGSKRVSYEHFLEKVKDGMRFAYPVKVKSPCLFCKGEQYVIYFTEEHEAALAYQEKAHDEHDGDVNYKKDNWSKLSDREREKRKDFERRAPLYGWQDEWESEYDLKACCWSAMEEKTLSRLRHMCTVCRGKKEEEIVLLRYRIFKSEGEATSIHKARIQVQDGDEETFNVTDEEDSDVRRSIKRSVILSSQTRADFNEGENTPGWLVDRKVTRFTYEGVHRLGEMPGCILALGNEEQQLQLWRGQKDDTLEIQTVGTNEPYIRRITLPRADEKYYRYKVVYADGRATIFANGCRHC